MRLPAPIHYCLLCIGTEIIHQQKPAKQVRTAQLLIQSDKSLFICGPGRALDGYIHCRAYL